MKTKISIALLSTFFCLFTACEGFLDTKIDTNMTPEAIITNRGTLWNFATAFYTPLTYGFTILDNNLFAAASDEAQQTAATGGIYYFNKGIINADVNPLDYLYDNYYEGIRAANFFLDYAKNGEDLLRLNRDTVREEPNYKKDLHNLAWYRAEAQVVKAYYYSELIKMYGGVPIVETTLDKDPNAGNISRSSYEEVVNYIVKLVDTYKDELQKDWETHPDAVANQQGRIDYATALAIKARTLLYAASPLNNPDNDKSKWEKAALASHDLILWKNYKMPENKDYRNYFSGNNPVLSKETIFIVRRADDNQMEIRNYPISTPGGNSGITPSENLVSAYEYIGPKDPDDPYLNRDPRLQASIVVNGSHWNGREIDQSPGGPDDMAKANTSKTGYYLKKFLTDEMNLVQGALTQHQWIVYRYAEVLLNYAEAMNEAYGPDAIPAGFTLSARQALTQVRRSASTNLPPVLTTDVNEFRKAIKHERQVELAFEDHRYWDLLRWKDAMETLNQPLKGVEISKDSAGKYKYQIVVVTERAFQERNYYLPFARREIVNSKGTMTQNPGY